MINFDSLALKLFADENKDFFIGAKFQKIQQPNRNELVFQIRSLGETRKFYVNFNPNFCHLCFMSKQNEEKRNISIPKSAPMFCMLLRKYIQNSKIIKIEVPKYERILEIYFEYFDELNDRKILCLAIELMGKYSNVILYNYDTNVIIGCAHNVSSEKSRERELAGLLPYIYPPKQAKKNLNKVTLDAFLKEVGNFDNIADISKKYHYLTIALVKQTIKLKNLSKLEDVYYALKTFLDECDYVPCILNDYSEYSFINLENSTPSSCINDMIDDYFAFHQHRFIIENLRTKNIRVAQSQLKKLYSLRDKQELQIKKIENAIIYKNNADIIMANSYYIHKGEKQANLYDFNGNAITIDLDENLSPTDNANKYYAQYKKAKSANEHYQILLQETLSQILYYEEIKFFSYNATSFAELQDIYDDLTSSNSIVKEKQEKIDFEICSGFKIFIGKNKQQNDYILSKLASSEDLWFHPLNAAGAHILVKKNNSKEIVPDNVLLKAAELTKEYSSQKDNSKTSIIYTARKYVKKANNKMAFVTYKNESEIIV